MCVYICMCVCIWEFDSEPIRLLLQTSPMAEVCCVSSAAGGSFASLLQGQSVVSSAASLLSVGTAMHHNDHQREK